MPGCQLTFERRELKYVLSDDERQGLERACAARMTPDEHGPSVVRSVYLDIPSLQIARTCEEHPSYREKLRLRAYGEPHVIPSARAQARPPLASTPRRTAT